MTDSFSVLSIRSIITSHTLIFRKYRKKFRDQTTKREVRNRKRNPKNSLSIEKLEQTFGFHFVVDLIH